MTQPVFYDQAAAFLGTISMTVLKILSYLEFTKPKKFVCSAKFWNLYYKPQNVKVVLEH